MTRTALRDAMRHALQRLNLPYEESDRSFSLPTLNNELLVEPTAIKWIFILRLKRNNRRVIRQIAAALNDSFRTAPAHINRRFGYALVVIGAAVLLFGSWITYRIWSLESKVRAMRETRTEFLISPEK